MDDIVNEHVHVICYTSIWCSFI